MSDTFQVDLRGIVDLLSHHLYASPRVYVRELLQNALDAVTARRVDDPHAPPGAVRIATDGGLLHVADNGIGLTEAQVHELLATIGRSSKRDELGFARHEFLGQFGIGLLSCFLVADEIRVHTRRAGAPPVQWTGYADGHYAVAPGPDREPGMSVTLVPRRGAEHWLTGAKVAGLARLYGSLLPVPVSVDGVETASGPPPWLAGTGSALVAYAERTFGFTPFDVIELDVPEAGLTGAAFVLPTPVNPASRGGHRVYLKRMLLAESVEGLLPEWAFFARCVVDAGELRPTASREALYEDSLLDATREALADQPRGWLVRLSATDPRRLAEFLQIHHLGVKALALHDDEMLGCEVVLRAFEPASLPALYLVTRSAAFHDELRATRERADELWGGVLDAITDAGPPDRPQLVLNHRNPLVRRVTALGDPELVALAVEALYGQALLLGHHPIRPADAALLNTSFLGLLGRAVPGERA